MHFDAVFYSPDCPILLCMAIISSFLRAQEQEAAAGTQQVGGGVSHLRSNRLPDNSDFGGFVHRRKLGADPMASRAPDIAFEGGTSW